MSELGRLLGELAEVFEEGQILRHSDEFVIPLDKAKMLYNTLLFMGDGNFRPDLAYEDYE